MIEVEHLSKTYGTTQAIEDVTFSVEKGEILGFLGPNGAGKTTTMRILTGYLPATAGTAKIAGFEVHENSMEVRQRIGYLPENPPLYPEMTVQGFLHFVARLKHVPRKERKQRVELVLERCSLLEKRHVIIRKLSRGFRQRVGIAQAIVHDPPVIILDEPTVGLDPRQIIEVRNLIKSLAGDHTIILSTHILSEASMTCNRIVIINKGKVVVTDTPEHLMAQIKAGAGYEVEVEGDVEAAQALLAALPGVSSVEVVPAEILPENHHRLRVISQPDVEIERDIAAAVVSAGMGLYEMRRIQASLEEVFLTVTTDTEVEEDVEEIEDAEEEIKDAENSEEITETTTETEQEISEDSIDETQEETSHETSEVPGESLENITVPTSDQSVEETGSQNLEMPTESLETSPVNETVGETDIPTSEMPVDELSDETPEMPVESLETSPVDETVAEPTHQTSEMPAETTEPVESPTSEQPPKQEDVADVQSDLWK
jgi:ABC-type multidrug transport system ATPase subunit